MEEKLNANAAAGNVYVFNVSNQNLNVATNGMQIGGGAIPPWAASGPNRYQPVSQAVPRTLNASDGPGKFFNGNNVLMLQNDGAAFSAQVNIDGSRFMLNQDVLLFIQTNHWQLIDQYGAQAASGPVKSSYD